MPTSLVFIFSKICIRKSSVQEKLSLSC